MRCDEPPDHDKENDPMKLLRLFLTAVAVAMFLAIPAMSFADSGMEGHKAEAPVPAAEVDPGQAGERLAGKAEELKGRAQEMKGRAEEKLGDLRDRASAQLD